MEVGAAAQRLPGADGVPAFAGVMDHDDGEREATLQLAQLSSEQGLIRRLHALTRRGSLLREIAGFRECAGPRTGDAFLSLWGRLFEVYVSSSCVTALAISPVPGPVPASAAVRAAGAVPGRRPPPPAATRRRPRRPPGASGRPVCDG